MPRATFSELQLEQLVSNKSGFSLVVVSSISFSLISYFLCLPNSVAVNRDNEPKKRNQAILHQELSSFRDFEITKTRMYKLSGN